MNKVLINATGIRRYILKILVVNKVLYKISRIFSEKDLNAHMKEWSVFRDRIPACFAAKMLNINKENNDGFLIDVGANYGLFFQQDELFNLYQVIAFEPNTTIHSQDRSNFKWESCAVSDKDGQCEFYIDKHHTGSSSLISANNHQTRINVKTTTIDKYLSESTQLAKIIKIDVEGAELSVLKGSANTIKNQKPIFFIETDYDSLPEIKKILTGYEFYKISVLGLDYSKNKLKRFFSVFLSLIRPNITLEEIKNFEIKKNGYIDNLIAIPLGFRFEKIYELQI